MASFRQRGNRWQARVRRLGHPDVTQSFLTRQDAERWARSVEIEIDLAPENQTEKAILKMRRPPSADSVYAFFGALYASPCAFFCAARNSADDIKRVVL